jgi:hypothetical protein
MANELMLELPPLVLDPVEPFFRFVPVPEDLLLDLKFLDPVPFFPPRPPRYDADPDLALDVVFLELELVDPLASVGIWDTVPS